MLWNPAIADYFTQVPGANGKHSFFNLDLIFFSFFLCVCMFAFIEARFSLPFCLARQRNEIDIFFNLATLSFNLVRFFNKQHQQRKYSFISFRSNTFPEIMIGRM